MLLRTPDFWQKTTLLPTLLTPLSYVYYGIIRAKMQRTTPHHAAIPIICIGNITAGGAGKTPVAIALAEMALQDGKNPHFLSRGYGGSMEGPVRVNSACHSAADVGDEPLLLARTAPTWVCRDRVRGAEAAIAAGAGFIIMDDGFQNSTLYKDVSILVIDGSKGFGNGKLLPAGPLREPVDEALARAELVVMIGEDTQNLVPRLTKPVIRAKLTPNVTNALNQRYIAFAGIGNPAKFFTTLTQAGAELIETLAFPDHYPYTEQDIAQLQAKASAANARLITTEKDAVRLPQKARVMIDTLPVRLVWEESPLPNPLPEGEGTPKSRIPLSFWERVRERTDI